MISLQQHLAGGGHLNFDVHRDLVDAMAATMSDGDRADRAAKARYDCETLADGGDLPPGRHLTPEQRAEAAQAAGFLADYLEASPDPELDRLIRRALPEPLGLHLEAQVRPHRLRVGTPAEGEYWSCDNCGATFASEEVRAALITDRPGHSSLHRDIVICRDCVGDAAVELGVCGDPAI